MAVNNTQAESTEDKLAPHSSEAEEAVLGSILIAPDSLNAIAGFLAPADFWHVSHGWIFEAMLAMADRGDDIDNVTLVHELEMRGWLADIGGSGKITKLINDTPTHHHVETYARIVEAAAIRRRLIQACGQAVQLALDGSDELVKIIQQSHDLITQATKIRSQGDFVFISEFASEVYDRIERAYNERGLPYGIPTGLIELDKLLVGQGFSRDELTIIAARPGVGKTSLAMGCGLHAAKMGQHVAVMSKEMSRQELQYRFLSGETAINGKALKSGNLRDGQFDLVAEATVRTSELNIAIDDTSMTDITTLLGRVKRLHREWRIDMLIVDYIQLLYSERRMENRNLEVAAISKALKETAKDLHVPVIALCQLNRNLEKRADKRPQMSDLRDSGSLEQDADNVIFIYRDDYYNEDSDAPGEAELHVAKQRNGESMPSSVCHVSWLPNVTKFADLHKENINLEGF